MSADRGWGLQLQGGMLTVEPGTGREGGSLSQSGRLVPFRTSDSL